MQGISRTVLAEELPFVQPMPPFKAWDYLVSNELAQGVGRQMYYTDEIGISSSANTYACTICQQFSTAFALLATSALSCIIDMFISLCNLVKLRWFAQDGIKPAL